MSKGFLVLAENTDKVDYLQQAYALALSIKATQQSVQSISLVTNDKVPKKYQKVFDNIIPIPWVVDTSNSRYKAENRWKLYYTSPYDETIVLDCDMLVLEDLSNWWDRCSGYDVNFCTNVRNHKLEIITSDFYRKTFTENNLLSPYFGLHYFRKSQAAYEFYKVLEFICNNWNWCYDHFAVKKYQDHLSMDLAVAIAFEISGCYYVDVFSPLEFIHMKPKVQGWELPAIDWRDSVNYSFNSNGELLVSNIKQSKIFHYVEKDFLNKSMLLKLEELANGKKD